MDIEVKIKENEKEILARETQMGEVYKINYSGNVRHAIRADERDENGCFLFVDFCGVIWHLYPTDIVEKVITSKVFIEE